MGNPWTFHNPVRISFGAGVRAAMAQVLPVNGAFLLVSTPSGRERLLQDAAMAPLVQSIHVLWMDDVQPNPDVEVLQNQIDSIRGRGLKAIFAIGGGSVIDTAKVLTLGAGMADGLPLRQLLAEPGLADAQEVLPLFVAPTTAGTGSEVTPFATVWEHATQKKHSLATPKLFPRQAFLDPELTLDLPEEATLFPGLDAICQASEAVWNRNANPLTDQLAIAALAQGLDALPRLLAAPHDLQARSRMMRASLFAGLAISHTRTALCHSMSYPLTATFGIPHGLACAFTMRAVFRLNLDHDETRFHGLAGQLGAGDPEALFSRVAKMLENLEVGRRARIHIPSLEALLALSDGMIHGGRADNNLAPVDPDILRGILTDSFAMP